MYTITMVINGLTVGNYLTFSTKSVNKGGLTMVPSSISPVLKQNIVFTLEADFPHALNRDDLTVNITNTDNNEVKYVRVVSVDDSTKTVTAKYGGAISGVYTV